MIKFFVVSLGLLVSLVCAEVSAQESRTLSVNTYQTTAGGNIRSCELSFSVSGQDFLYKDGAEIVANGNLAVFKTPIESSGPIIFGFKLKVYDNISGNYVPARISQTHLSLSDGTIWKSENQFIADGDAPGVRIHTLFLNDEASKFIDQLFSSGTFGLAFNREDQGPDVPLAVNVKQIFKDEHKLIDGNNELIKLIECFGLMLNDIKETEK
jgi:hypothetical protein